MAFEKLAHKTYVLEHSPNCPSPYLVRLVGKGQGKIDHLHPSKTKDILIYGKTPEEVVENALKAIGEL